MTRVLRPGWVDLRYGVDLATARCLVLAGLRSQNNFAGIGPAALLAPGLGTSTRGESTAGIVP